jgi:hypothetical protein
MKGCRIFDIDAIVKWRQDHPNWCIPSQKRWAGGSKGGGK